MRYAIALRLGAALAFVLPLVLEGSQSAQAGTYLTWIQQSPSISPSSREFFGMAFDSTRARTVLFGGQLATGAQSNETWEWDGSNWTLRQPTLSPDPRNGMAMAYDSTRGVTVMFGGELSSETWEWDGTTWTPRYPAHVPPARNFASLAFDSRRDRTVLFGGTNVNGGQWGDTWEWDGNDWAPMAPTSAPPARTEASLDYDSARGVTVLFGGFSAGNRLSDTWEWDGVNWTQRSSSQTPPKRSDHTMVYDSQQHVTLLYGGIGGNGTATETLGDTWMWDGANWTLAPLATPNPPARAYHGMSFDAARGVSVIFGGLGAVNYVDTWLGGFGITAPLTLTTNGSVETEGIPDNIGPATVSGGTPPYSASIDWGDGTTSSATFNGFQVVGNHLYVEEGTYPVNVVVTDSSGSRIAATTTTFVSDAPLYAQGAGNMNVSRKKAFTARVASFNDQDPGGAVTDYNASIDWGDGTTTAASSISFAGGLTFNVYGTHAYAVKGTYSVTTRISDSGGATADPVVTTIVVNGT